MITQPDVKLDFQDVLIMPKKSSLKSRSEVNLEVEYLFKYSRNTWRGVPVIASNMDATGTFNVAKVLAQHHLMTAIHKFYRLNDWNEFLSTVDQSILDYLILTSGISEEDIAKLYQLIDLTKIQTVCLDIANGYLEEFSLCVKKVRDAFPNLIIMAGNVVTGDMTKSLILAGADVVKIGIGPGSVCTTRHVTGVGYPQFSAIVECAQVAEMLGGKIIADGGCVCPGDVSKAFGAGAHFVMLGGLFAGHDESSGEIIEINSLKYKRFYGMSSAEAMTKYYGGTANYRATEGKCVLMPYRGPLESTVREILGGLRSTCTYVGAPSLSDLSQKTTFLRVQHQWNQVFSGMEESKRFFI